MDNIYLDVADLLINNLLLSDLNHDMIGRIYTVGMYILFLIGLGLAVSPLFFYSIYNRTMKHEAFALFVLGIVIAIAGMLLGSYRKEHNMEQALIQSKETIHMLATKHNVDDKVAWKIAQDIVFCETGSLKYTANPSVTIQCENNNYYGQKVDYDKVKANLNLIQKNHDPELFIMRK